MQGDFCSSPLVPFNEDQSRGAHRLPAGALLTPSVTAVPPRKTGGLGQEGSFPVLHPCRGRESSSVGELGAARGQAEPPSARLLAARGPLLSRPWEAAEPAPSGSWLLPPASLHAGAGSGAALRQPERGGAGGTLGGPGLRPFPACLEAAGDAGSGHGAVPSLVRALQPLWLCCTLTLSRGGCKQL